MLLNFIKNKKKAQISLELIIVVILLILFLHIYSYMSDLNIDTLEISKIKEQQNNISKNLNNFYLDHKNLFSLSNSNYRSFNVDYKIDDIKVASKKVNCTIDVNSTHIIITSPQLGGIRTTTNVNLSSSNFIVPKTFYCGQTIKCINTSDKLDCS